MGGVGDQAALAQRVGERTLFVQALGDLALGVLERDHAKLEPFGDVGAAHQPANVGRSWVETQATASAV